MVFAGVFYFYYSIFAYNQAKNKAFYGFMAQISKD